MIEETILLVDDEEDICEILDISLSDLGYKVYTAENGEKALQIFREVNPPIVIADIRMPGMDGIELLQKIKQENAETEVIMITGHGDMDLAIKSLKYEATDFITKPINDEVLEFALKRAHERISMRQKIREYTIRLEKLVHEILGLSHTIKTIAGGLEGGTFVLEKGIELGQKEYVLQGWDMIRVSVETIKNLSLDVLNYAKHTDMNYRLCDPNKPAKEVAALMNSRAEQYGVDLKIDLAPDLEALLFDPEGIHHCLLNLVSNAIDATAGDDCFNKEKEVLLRTVKIDGWGVEYQVTDTGCGIDEEIKEKIFKGFFSTKGPMGTGIGLMITKKIVDEHKGVIEVESEKRSGTKFTIRLPEKTQI
ncbi:MAG: hybrid sensor histidine kinase/response regulator [Pseudomonadota bacterium]